MSFSKIGRQSAQPRHRSEVNRMSDKTFVQDYIDDLSRLLPILNSERIAEVIVLPAEST